MPILEELEQRLDRLDGREVRIGTATQTNTARGDSAEAIAAALRRRKIVRER